MASRAVADRPLVVPQVGSSVDVLAARWGAAAAWAFTGVFVVYNAAYAVLALTGPNGWRGVEDYLQTWTVLEFVPQMLGLVALPLLGFALVAAHRLAPPPRRVFTLAALACGLAFLTVVWVGYFVQVAWLLPTLRAGTATPGVELLVWRGMASPGWAVNVAGWVLSGFMAWALAAALLGGRFETRARWLFVAYGVAQLLLIPWFALGMDVLGIPIAVSWVVVLPVATGHLAVWMHRAGSSGSSP
jgi:hypothetical protein